MNNETKVLLPEVRIKFAWLLTESASVHLNKLWGNGSELKSYEFYENRAKEYDSAWRALNGQTITAMCEILGLSFRQNIIDVNIAPWFAAFSDPMVIGVVYKPDNFVDVLTHELLHRLLTDNTSIDYDTKLIPVWRKLFGNEHSITSLVHIPVHAVHKKIYLDVMKDPSRFERDVENKKEFGATDYVAAWDYVNKMGYEEIIKMLRESYAELHDKQNKN